mmetsp:Transcript_6503/g.16448  ORF Transcript_6503/g.16448 Transcript_6503/m.16448 type:complete len:173 (+) Transcript_6503:477-995(+)
MNVDIDLTCFPFDINCAAVELQAGNTHRLSDGSKSGFDQGSFTVRRFDPRFDGVVNEWRLLGVSSRINVRPPNPQGIELISVTLGFHLSRKPAYYFWKVMLPLYMLTLLSFGTFEFEVDNLGDRNSSVSTYFLAAFAMLYVVGESIPKTEYLNKIDQVHDGEEVGGRGARVL